MADHHQRGPGLLPDDAQGVEDQRLDGHVEGRRGLIRDDQLRRVRDRHRDHDPLAHAARQLVRVPVRELRGLRQARPRRAGRPPGARRPTCSPARAAGCTRRPATPTVYIGFSAVIGSWKTMLTRAPRIDRHCAGVQSSSSRPSSRIDPLTFADPGTRPRAARASMVLPEPDSPTTPSVSLAVHGEADAADRLDQAGLGRDADPQVGDLQQRPAAETGRQERGQTGLVSDSVTLSA